MIIPDRWSSCAGSFHLNKDATEQQIRSPPSKSARGAAALRVRVGVASTHWYRRVNQELAVSVRSSLLVQHHTQKRSIDLKTAVVLDETQLPEFVHEEVDP